MSKDCSINNKGATCSCHSDGADDHDFSPKKEIITLSILLLLFFTANIFIYLIESNILNYIGLSILAVVYIYSGIDIFRSAVKNLISSKIFDENLLMSVATISAIIIGAYSEAVAVLLFYRTGEFLQEYALNKSRRSIRSLLEFKVDYVNKVTGKNIIKVDATSINIGDIIEIQNGDKVPVDSVIISGETDLDMKSLTGESLPKYVKKGDVLIAGSLNLSNPIRAKVRSKYEDSYISKILNLVETARHKKAKTENFITTFAKYYTPAVFFLSILVAITPPLLGLGTLSDWVYRALVVLVVSCPCALVISIPLGYFASIGAATKLGILVKGASYLEALTHVKTIVFDKTATLTKGEFDVTDIKPFGKINKERLAELAYHAMIRSNHPISKSIIRYLDSNFNIKTQTVNTSYKELKGYGVELKYKNKILLAGNAKLMQMNNIQLVTPESIGTITYFAYDKKYIGYINLNDNLRDDTKLAIEKIKKMGISKLMIISGDNKSIVENTAKQLEIKDYYAEILPIEKATLFKEYSLQNGGKSIYIGDGVNDAPVLALADVGISFADISSDIAVETADIIFMKPSIDNISTSIKLAKRTKIIIWQNIIFALTIKLLFIILGLFGIATIYEAVFGDVGVALLALLNAMRLLKA